VTLISTLLLTYLLTVGYLLAGCLPHYVITACILLSRRNKYDDDDDDDTHLLSTIAMSPPPNYLTAYSVLSDSKSEVSVRG